MPLFSNDSWAGLNIFSSAPAIKSPNIPPPPTVASKSLFSNLFVSKPPAAAAGAGDQPIPDQSTNENSSFASQHVPHWLQGMKTVNKIPSAGNTNALTDPNTTGNRTALTAEHPVPSGKGITNPNPVVSGKHVPVTSTKHQTGIENTLTNNHSVNKTLGDDDMEDDREEDFEDQEMGDQPVIFLIPYESGIPTCPQGLMCSTVSLPSALGLTEYFRRHRFSLFL